MLSLNSGVLAVKMLVLKLARNRAYISLSHVAHRSLYSIIGAVALRTGSNKYYRVCKRDFRLGKPHHKRCVHRRLYYRDYLRIGKPYVLASANHKPPARARQIARLKQSCKIVKRRVGVASPHAFLICRNYVIVLVAVLVISQRAFLRKLLGGFKRNRFFTFL